MSNVSAIVNEFIDGGGYFVLPGLITPARAHEARSLVLAALADQPTAQQISFGQTASRRNGHDHVGRLFHKGRIFEELVQLAPLIEIAEAMLGDDMTLSAYSVRVLNPGATEMGVHIDYPYWAMRGPHPVRPPLMMQVILMLQDFTEHNGATLVAPGSQRGGRAPDRERFAREAIKLTGRCGSAILSHGLLWHDTSKNHTDQPRVALLVNYSRKVIRPMVEDIADVPEEAMARATPKLRQLLGLEFRKALAKDLISMSRY
jgi:ectoine hydroxylase-related dioxygenase (phytanoyl-CoA dioxygenase family)